MPVVVDDGSDEAKWLAARRTGISATTIAKAMTPAGRAAVIEDYLHPQEDDGRLWAYRDHGHKREREFLGDWIAEHFGMRHNTALWAHEVYTRHLATPDGVADPGQGLYELKTSTKPLPRTTPRPYRDQMQWQMHVMGEDRVLLVWEHHEDFIPVGLPEWRWTERDDERITEMVGVADSLLFEMDTLRWEQGNG